MADIVIIGTPVVIVNYPLYPVVSTAELAAWLRMPSGQASVEATLLATYISMATEIVENYTWLTLRETTFVTYFAEVYPYVYLEATPILGPTSITSIKYLYENGTDIEYATYALGTYQSSGSYANLDMKLTPLKQAFLYLNNTDSLVVPDKPNQYNMQITYKAGYQYDAETSAYIMPQSLKTAILMLAAKYYTDRGDCIGCVSAEGCLMPGSVKMLLDMYSLRNATLGSDPVNPFTGQTYQTVGML